MNTTSTPALSSGAASLAITSAGVAAGTVTTAKDPNPNNIAQLYTIVTDTGMFPVFGIPSDGTKRGAFLTQTPDFVGSWVLTRRTSGIQGDNPTQQIVLRGTAATLQLAGTGPLANLTATDMLTLTIIDCRSGTVTMTLVQ